MRSPCKSIQPVYGRNRLHVSSDRLQRHSTKYPDSDGDSYGDGDGDKYADSDPDSDSDGDADGDAPLTQAGHIGIGRQRGLAAEVRVQHP